MHILVINPGSSSIKFSMYEDDRAIYQGEFSGIGEISAALEFRDASGRDLSAAAGGVQGISMEDAIGNVKRDVSLNGLPAPDAVGYRVVHPGPHLRGHQRITPAVLAELHNTIAYAPLHNPEALQVIEAMMQRWPQIPHFACFDTVFHETMPEEATVYPLPEEVRAQGVRRYGFHGLSCESIVAQMQTAGVMPQRMLIAHLGSGCSITACIDGSSVDTTMGLTPMGGVVMGTRPGDIDPGLVIYLARQPGASIDSVEDMLNRHSGIKVLGGVNDMRELRRRADTGDEKARLAIAVFCRSIIKTIAGLAALHSPQALVFTGGIGEHDAASRQQIVAHLTALGFALNLEANRTPAYGVQSIGASASRIAIYVAPAQEDLVIARHVARMCHKSLSPAATSS